MGEKKKRNFKGGDLLPVAREKWGSVQEEERRGKPLGRSVRRDCFQGGDESGRLNVGKSLFERDREWIWTQSGEERGLRLGGFLSWGKENTQIK